MNSYVVAKAEIPSSDQAVLHIGGTAFYRAFADGKYLANGPARAAEGCIREDVIALPIGTRNVTIEAVGYYCRSLATVFQPSFLIAEIEEGGRVVYATDEDTKLYAPPTKLQKTERYSVQRHFSEVYDLRGEPQDSENYRVSPSVVEPGFTVLPRRAPYPCCRDVEAGTASAFGALTYDESIAAKRYRYSWPEVPEYWGIFPWDEIEYHPHFWIQKQIQRIEKRNEKFPIAFRENEYAIVRFGRIEAGFIKLSVSAEEESEIIVAFAEHCESENFAFPNMNVHNAVEWIVPKGFSGELMTIEPYTAAIAMIAVKRGNVKVERFGIKTYETDDSAYRRGPIDDPALREIYEAAIRNYRHNAVDLFTDCPSRERAGWLGDAYFTSQAEFFLTGKTETEDAYLENLLRFRNHGEIPEGALPETYPSDIYLNTFIPQFDFWMLLEVADHLEKRNHMDKVSEFRPLVENCLAFFEKYENEDALLERLPSWNFVEWSKANDWTRDVNYPTNFLYGEVLRRLGKVFRNDEWSRKGSVVTKNAFAQSFDGTLFRDHAVRDERGSLSVCPDTSEVCQYYAMLFGGLSEDDERFAIIVRKIRTEFEFGRAMKEDGILPSEMIFGVYLRMQLLMKWGEREILKRDLIGLFGKMHEGTDTLWEYLSGKGSRDHGMCSFVTIPVAFVAGNL